MAQHRSARRILAVGVLALSIVGLGSIPTSASAPTGASGKGGVDRDATLRIATASLTSTLDPTRMTSGYLLLSHFMYDTLFILGPQGELLPGLGTDQQISADGKTVTIPLRDDAVFIDGSPVDAAAVKASIDRARTAGSYVGLLKNIANVVAVDPQTVRLELSQPDASVMFTLGGVAGSIINPKALTDGTDLTKTSAGSTPYRVVEWTPPSRIVLERVEGLPAYWDKKAWTPKRIEVTATTDATALNNGILTDQFDVARLQSPVPEAQELLGKVAKVLPVQTGAQYAMYFRPDNPATPNQAVRTALGQAIDRKAIATNVMANCVPAEQMIRKGTPGYVKGYAPFEYDPKAAAKVFKDEGFTELEMMISATNVEEKKFVEIAQQDLAEMGVKMTIVPLAVTEAIGQFNSGSRQALTLGYAAQPDLAMSVANEFLGVRGLAGAAAPQLSALVAEANGLPIESKSRTTQLEEVGKAALEQATLIPICSITSPFAARKDIRGVGQSMPNAFATFNARYWSVMK